jgi:hypothetical protein
MWAEVIGMKETCQRLKKVVMFCGTQNMCNKFVESIEWDVYYSDSINKHRMLGR